MEVECGLGCGKPLNPYDIGVWKEVLGWVGGPKKDSMRLREDTGRFAHNACVQKFSQGQAPDQVSLLDEPPVAVPADDDSPDLWPIDEGGEG